MEIPAQGYAFYDITDPGSIPEGAVIERLRYSVRVAHGWVGEISLTLFSSENTRLDIWPETGEETDGGEDDDAPDDHDIELLHRETDAFDGEPVFVGDAPWTLRAIDHDANGEGFIDSVILEIDWVIPGPELQVLESVGENNDLVIPFGEIQTGDTALESMTLWNLGPCDLEIVSMTIVDTQVFNGGVWQPESAEIFQVGDPVPNSPLIPLATAEVPIEFTPAFDHDYRARLLVLSNASNDLVELELFGSGAAPPNLRVESNGVPFDEGFQFDLGLVDVDELPQCHGFVRKNVGGLPLEVGDVQVSPPFTVVSGGSETLDGGEMDIFDVCIDDVEPGVYTTTVQFSSNDPDEGDFSFSIRVVVFSPDLDGDGVVNSDDLFALLGNWGDCPAPCPPACVGDLDHDCGVDSDDLFLLLGAWEP